MIHNVIPGLACQALVTLLLPIDTAGGAEMGVRHPNQNLPPQPSLPVNIMHQKRRGVTWPLLAFRQ